MKRKSAAQKKASSVYEEKRKYPRFKPEPTTVALIDPITEKKAFAPTMVAIVLSECYAGCGLLLERTGELQVGAFCRIQVGRQSPMIAEIRWRTDLDPQVMKLGLQFLE